MQGVGEVLLLDLVDRSENLSVLLRLLLSFLERFDFFHTLELLLQVCLNLLCLVLKLILLKSSNLAKLTSLFLRVVLDVIVVDLDDGLGLLLDRDKRLGAGHFTPVANHLFKLFLRQVAFGLLGLRRIRHDCLLSILLLLLLIDEHFEKFVEVELKLV